ncbi:MAG TPA: c-type cytochrome [Bryobacteraceae bacterium]|nr:c-type cytochrome [Bryobacteraceae bacterium]
MKRFTPQCLIVGLALMFGPAAAVAADQPTKTIKTVPAKDTQTLDGKTMFHEYCAVCHGDDGKGNGPAADALKKAPADLTQIARKNGGAFPEVKVQRIITGADDVAAHGNRAMPIWGNIFRSLSGQEGETLRVNALMKYVEGLQAK